MQRAALAVMILIPTLTMALPGPPATADIDLDELRRFVDSHFETALAETGIAGAMVAVVRGDETLLLAGYGTRDVGTGEPVDPEATLYRLGSITKPMTAIAVLQLVERGLLDLDEDVNRYLRRARIPSTYPEPITLRHLLTHTGGLDGDMTYTVVGPPGTSAAAPDAMIQRRLARVRPPGNIAAYDVLGYGVLSIVLQDVTGETFETVLRRAVFDRAGMDRAAVGLPERRLDELARCHVSTRPGDARTCDHGVLSELYQGSGDVAATAADMAAFMKALLRQERGEDGPLLSQASFRELTDFDQYRFHPASRGLGLGIQELEYAGRQAFGHGGGIQGFNNSMDLFPDSGIGIYFGVNGETEQIYDARLSMLPRLLPDRTVPAEVHEAIAHLWSFPSRFAREFLPEPAPVEQAADTRPPVPAAELGGTYLHTRFVSDNVLINLSRLSLMARIVADGDRIWIDGRGPYEQIRPGRFEGPDGRTAEFRIDQGGTWVSFGREPFATYERVSWWARPVVSVIPLAPALLLLATSMLYLLPRFSGARRRAAMLWLVGAGLFLAGFLLELEYGVMLAEIRGYLLLPSLWRAGIWIAVGAFLIAPVVAVVRWRGVSERTGWMGGIHSALLGIAGLYVVGFSLYWRLLG